MHRDPIDRTINIETDKVRMEGHTDLIYTTQTYHKEIHRD